MVFKKKQFSKEDIERARLRNQERGGTIGKQSRISDEQLGDKLFRINETRIKKPFNKSLKRMRRLI